MKKTTDCGRKSLGCSGYCRRCRQVHSLEGLGARSHAENLIEKLDSFGRIDFLQPPDLAVPSYSTDVLFGPARGKMFGVLLCRDRQGREVVLYAFSGQYNGQWQVPGWVGPLFDEDAFHRCHDDREREIKALGRAMDEKVKESEAWKALKNRRRQLSRNLMEDIFSLYRVPDFRGEEHLLLEAFTGEEGMPTGTGDCCAPKLLAYAAGNNLLPVSLVEFYYGRENASGSCVHKRFYPSCTTKCQLILGAMLCGLEEHRALF